MVSGDVIPNAAKDAPADFQHWFQHHPVHQVLKKCMVLRPPVSHGGPSLALRRRLQSLAGGLTLHIWTSHDVPWLASDDDLPRHPEWQSGR
jgi:hypothetical protein